MFLLFAALAALVENYALALFFLACHFLIDMDEE